MKKKYDDYKEERVRRQKREARLQRARERGLTLPWDTDTTYRVTFPTRGWFYYGIHSTDDLNDGIVVLLDKWKNHDWEMEILQFHDTREELMELETGVN